MNPQEAPYNYVDIGAGCVDENNKLWLSSLDVNSIFCYDLNTEKLEWKALFPGEDLWKSFLYRKCVYYHNKVYFIPFNAKELAIYDTQNGIIKKIPIESLGVSDQKYYNSLIYDEKLYLFGENVPLLAIFDLKLEVVTYVDDLYREIDKKRNTGFYKYIGKEYVYFDNRSIIYMHGWRCRSVIEFDLNTLHFSISPIGNGVGVYNNILTYDNKILLVPGKGERFTVYNIENNKESAIGEIIEERASYYLCFRFNDGFFVLPDKEKKILYINLDDGSFQTKSLSQYLEPQFVPIGSNEFPFMKFLFMLETNTEIIFFCRMNKTLYRIDRETGVIKKNRLYMELISRAKYAKERMSSPDEIGQGTVVLTEALRFTLDDFIKMTYKGEWGNI